MSEGMDALLGASQEIKAGDNQLKRISSLVHDELGLEDELATAEAMVTTAKEKINQLKQQLIPEAMTEAGVSEFTDADTGTKVSLALAVSGALGSPKTPEEAAEKERKLNVLVEHGAEEILKVIVAVEFGKGQMGKAIALKHALATRGLEPILERTIHHQTLCSWLRKKMEGGAEIPMDDLGMWYGTIAKIKPPKAEADA